MGPPARRVGLEPAFEQFRHVRTSLAEIFSPIFNPTGQRRPYDVDSFLLTPNTT